MNRVAEIYIEKYDQALQIPMQNHIPIGLFHGKMGISICYFELAHRFNNEKYRQFAEKLLDDIYIQVDNHLPINFDVGLSGIAWGISYLVRNDFFHADLNPVLSDLSDKIFHDLNFNWMKLSRQDVYSMINIMPYLVMKLESESPDSEEYILFKKLIIKVINSVDSVLTPDYFKEPTVFDMYDYLLPIYLYMLGDVYRLGVYNSKIVKVLDELSGVVLSTFPLLHSNRMFLLLGMRKILSQVSLDGWLEHASLLEQNVDCERIAKAEMRNRNVYFNNGICGCYWIYEILRKYDPSCSIVFDRQQVLDKIRNSLIWKEDFESLESFIAHAGFMGGFPGIILTYELFLKD